MRILWDEHFMQLRWLWLHPDDTGWVHSISEDVRSLYIANLLHLMREVENLLFQHDFPHISFYCTNNYVKLWSYLRSGSAKSCYHFLQTFFDDDVQICIPLSGKAFKTICPQCHQSFPDKQYQENNWLNISPAEPFLRCVQSVPHQFTNHLQMNVS